ncbi:MAG: biotin--[acetyl-CoA-carboxylase] ligase [Proteobacteria bacterium]|nr:biotin--[acetyl-CoA-carboxylase] ligase [Pseudomonadota bacterium]
MKKIIGCKIVRLKETDSTNRVALSPEYAMQPPGTVIIARRQTAGKGRKKRVWYSEEGGIYMSILFNEVDNFGFFYKFAILAALGVKETLERLTHDFFFIKWPNDIYFHDKKICGILLQSTTQGESNRVVIGIGININNSVFNLPEGIKEKSTSLTDITGKVYDIENIEADILERLNKYYASVENGDFKFYLPAINEFLYKKGEYTEFLLGVNVRGLKIIGIDEEGRLIAEDRNENRLNLDFGEVL